jgi:hypothetical protein
MSLTRPTSIPSGDDAAAAVEDADDEGACFLVDDLLGAAGDLSPVVVVGEEGGVLNDKVCLEAEMLCDCLADVVV